MLFFYAKRGYSSWIYGVVLWALQSPSLSRSYQGLYRVYLTDTIGSTAELKALQSQCTLKLPIGFTYLNHKSGERRLVTREKRGRSPFQIPPQSPTIIDVPNHRFSPDLIAWKKCIEITPFYRWIKVTWV
jgi:hypothetical protein